MPATATNLRTEYRIAPLGIGEPEPRLSWWVDDDRAGARQTAFRIRVASTPEGLAAGTADLWDSGRVDGDAQVAVYAGHPLAARQEAAWDVTLWDGDGVEGQPSRPASFSLGLLAAADWSATWIGTPILEGGMTLTPAPLLRKEFDLATAVRSARLHITALGLYDAEVNGQRVAPDAYLLPGWTEYRTRIPVQTWDVTALVQTGSNCIGVTLGDGWWSGRVAWHERGTYGPQPALLAQLEVTHADGTVTTVATDDTWTWAHGPVRGQDILQGEEYDARKEVPGWSTVGGGGDAFLPVERRDWPGAALTPALMGPVVEVQEFPPVAAPRRVDAGAGRVAFAFDLGQNFSGVVRLQVKGPAGATIRLRHAEMLDAKGNLLVENLRSARATDYYTLKGDPDGETYTPRFTFHGFRHVEVSFGARWRGQIEHFDESTVTGVALSSAVDSIGSFACSDDRLNQLQSNIRWGQRSNFIEVPTDCPQRDERLGWTGDAQVFAPTALFNYDVHAFFTKWSVDIDDAQDDEGRTPMVVPQLLDSGDSGPGWSDARVLWGWAGYQATGDRRLLERHYDQMVKWMDWQASTAKDGVRCYDGCGYFQGFSDWLALDSTWQAVFSATPRDFCGTSYFAYSSGVMHEIATILGRADDAARFAEYRGAAVAGWNREFVTGSGRLAVQTQTAHLMALAWDFLDEDLRPAVLDRLLALLEEPGWHLSTGFLGTPLLLPVLQRFGRTDVAYRVLMSDEYPGWLYPVVHGGATTMWERWNAWTEKEGFGDASMNSFNHYAYGAVGRWLYDVVGGLRLDPARPGYKHVIVQPELGGGITWAKTALDSTHGPVAVEWKLDSSDFALDVTVPANTTATVVLPDGERSEIVAGRHSFKCTVPA